MAGERGGKNGRCAAGTNELVTARREGQLGGVDEGRGARTGSGADAASSRPEISAPASPAVRRGILSVTVLAAFLLVGATARAQLQQQPAGPFTDSRELPADRPAVKRSQELLEVVKARDAKRLREYVREAFAPSFLEAIPLEGHVNALSGMADDAADWKLHGIRNFDPPRPDTEATLIYRNELTEAWLSSVIAVEAEPPHRITSISVRPAPAPAGAGAPTPVTHAEAVRQIEAFVNRLAEAGRFSGAVLVARGDEVLYEAAHGEADLGHHVKNAVDTKFNLGSMNKMFTAVAVAQLAERGKLSFDDPISKYVDESWLPKEVTDKVTVAHLLTHTSGLGSYFNETYENTSRLKFRELDDYKPLVRGEKLAFEPGSRWGYSNTGFLLLGVVVEKASGQNYFEYVRDHVYKPAGMANSDSYALDEVVENVATGYYRQGGKLKNNTLLHVMRGGPAGGGYSTVRDLHHFARALLEAKLLREETVELLWSPKPASPGYGYGFQLGQAGGKQHVGHSGGFPGISSGLTIFTGDGDYVIAVMCNQHDARPVVERARALLGTASEGR